MKHATTFQKALAAVRPEYRDYVEEIDRKEAVALLEFYRQNAKPEDYLEGLGADFAVLDIPAYVDNLFNTTRFTSIDKLAEAKNFSELMEDPT